MTNTDYIAQAIGPRSPGSVTWNGYWQTWELTLAVETHRTDWMAWSVTQVDCDEYGVRKAGAPVRTHCTAWELGRDRLVTTP